MILETERNLNNQQIQKTIRCATEQSEMYQEILVNQLNPGCGDFVTIEKVSVMVGVDFSQAVFFGILDSVKRHQPAKPVGYFFGALKKQVPDIYKMMEAIFVRP